MSLHITDCSHSINPATGAADSNNIKLSVVPHAPEQR